MEISILNLIHKRIPTARILVGVGLVAILALMTVMAAGTARAADSETKGSGLLLAANDAHAADAAKKDAKASDAKAKAPAKEAKKSYGPIGTIFAFLGSNMFVFLFLSISLGYPLGRVSVKGVNLGSTAGTLIVGIAISLTAFMAFDITYTAPGLVSTIFLLLFMYAIGMKVGPQFFSGIARGGLDFVVIGLIVAFANFLICFFGAKLAGMAPGYAAGIISGSYTITAVMGVAQSAVASGAVTLPQGVTANAVGANLAAGYAVSYVLSSIFTILVIKYLPVVCGIDPVQAGKDAEASFGAGEGSEALPGTVGTSVEGVSPMDIRAYRVEHEELVGQSVEALFRSWARKSTSRVCAM